MRKLTPICILAIFLFLAASCDKKEEQPAQTSILPIVADTAFNATVTFPSIDSLMITADVYHIHKDSAVIVLCHQAGWSRGEYKEIAPKLNELGYNCVAIDQRSGNAVNGVTNETAKLAAAANLPQNYTDAKQDIVAAVNYASLAYGKKVYLWGSSYSSSLVLIVAKENNQVHTVLSFSPGEYLKNIDVKASISGLNKPAFLTSSKTEQNQTKLLFDAITSSQKTQFIPAGDGEHGSRALWSEKADHAEYWIALKAFLKN